LQIIVSFFSNDNKAGQLFIATGDIIENYNEDSMTTENLLKLKEYYFKKKYLHCILDRIDD